MDAASVGERLSAALAGTGLGPVEWVAETGSTNDDLIGAAGAGAPSGLVRVADHQTAGRGRRDRRWVDDPGAGLLFSLLWRVAPGDAVAAASVVWALSTGAVEALAARGVQAAVKWPNDLVADQRGDRRKLAGVLAQSAPGTSDLAVVAGMGLNVASTPLEGAVSLRDLGVDVDRADLLSEILASTARWLQQVREEGPEALHRAWGRHSATVGTAVRVDRGSDVVEGVAVALAPDGALVVETDDGPVTVIVGDVVSSRPLR